MSSKNVFRKNFGVRMNDVFGKNKRVKKSIGIEFQSKKIPVRSYMMNQQNFIPNYTGKEIKDFHNTHVDQNNAQMQIGNSKKLQVRQPQNRASSSQKCNSNQSYQMKSKDINNKVIIESKDKEPEDGNKNYISLSKMTKMNEDNENSKAQQAKKLVGAVKEKTLLYKQRPQSNSKIANRPVIIDAKKEIDKKEQLIYQILNEQTPNKSKLALKKQIQIRIFINP